MARKKIETPCKGRLRCGGDVTILKATKIGGMPAYLVVDTDGEKRNYLSSNVIPVKS